MGEWVVAGGMIALAFFMSLLAFSMLIWLIWMLIVDTRRHRATERALASTGMRRVKWWQSPYSTHGQSRAMSVVESVSNVVVGYGVAVSAQIAVFPFFGIEIAMRSNLLIGAIFTVVSLCRSYALRRAFNAISHRRKIS